jgi:Flp pilus assembly pilin Flp
MQKIQSDIVKIFYYSFPKRETKMRKFLKNLLKNRKGQGLVEYAFIVAGVAFVCLLALAVFGHKVSDQYSVMAGMLPGAHAEDNAPVASQSFLQTSADGSGNITSTGRVTWKTITGGTEAGELDNNVIVAGNGNGDAFVADAD